MTSPYHFYFIVVPREASNLIEVKIWGCCCPETIFGAAPYKFVKILYISFGPENSCAYAPGYIQTFVSLTLFDLSNIKTLKNSTFVSCSVLTDFCHYSFLPLYRFVFEFF
jgi:hypothetical protein